MDKSEKRSHSFASTLGKVAKAGAFAGGAAGIGALTYGLKIGIGEWVQSTKVAAQTAAVLKSTGGIANVTAKHIDSLGTSLMKKSGVDDEVIKSGENMLLTFKNIRNEAGAGNQVFDQSTKTLLDMSTALGQDMSKSAIQLGKALNDPIKGVGALRRVGVTFTDSQKATIKSLVDSGHTMQAQKIILHELNSEFGGSAEAMGKTLPGQINILKESFNNWAGDMVGKMIPVLQRFGGWIREHWPEISATIRNAWVNDIRPPLSAMIELVGSVVSAVRNHWTTIGPMVKTVATIISTQVKAITEILRTLSALLRGDWSEAWNHLKKAVGAAINGIKTEIRLEVQVIKTLMVALGNAALDGLRAGLAGVRDLFVNHVVHPAASALTGLPRAIGGAIADAMGDLKDRLKSLFSWHRIVKWIKDALGFGSPSPHFMAIGHDIVDSMVKGVGDASGVLKSAVVRLAKDAAPGIPHFHGVPGFGGGDGGKFPGAHAEGSAEVYLVPWAHQEGIGITSIAGGKHVKGSYHYRHRAIDVAGTAQQMKKFFYDSIGHFGIGNITELFYDPIGSYIKNGHVTKGAIGGHSDHVHIALAKGGIATRAMNALIGERGPEAVIPLSSHRGQAALAGRGGGDVYIGPFNFPGYVGDESVVTAAVRDAIEAFQNRNGRPAFGSGF